VATGDVARNPLLEQAVRAGEQLGKVLRLLCLSSVVGGGLPRPAYDRYRAMILDVRRSSRTTRTLTLARRILTLRRAGS
jgi:hypothetical protein